MYYKDVEDKRTFWGLTLGILFLALGIGYAVLSSNLIINGSSKIKNSTWDIHFENVVPKQGSVAIGTGDQAATINPNDNTEVTYIVSLDKPGDYYEFEVDAVNDGTVDGMVDTITSTYKIGNEEPVIITDSSLPNYLDYSVTYSDGKPILQNHELKANTSETYKVRVEFRRDIQNNQLPADDKTIVFNFGVEYKQADSNAIPVRVQPVSFATDEWDTIARAVQDGNTSLYNVGDTKTVDMGEFGTHTLRIANKSTPAECSTEGFSQTACGFVLEFADVITTYNMNSTSTNVGGWPASEMRTYLNNDIYNTLPTALKNAICDTTVVSGYGNNDSENFTSTDKLYLLSTHEVWQDVDGDTSAGIDYYDTAYNNTRQLDYYAGQNVTTSSYEGAIKKYNGSNSYLWLRTAISAYRVSFSQVGTYGHSCYGYTGIVGVSPAFRLA